MKWRLCRLTFGIISSVIALGAVAISFATDQWINCQVKYSYDGSLSSNPLYNCTYCPELFYTRNRGLFRTCFPGSGTQWINEYPYLRKSLVDSVCLAERGYGVSPGDPTADSPYYSQWADYYQMRTAMMSSHWGLFVVAIVLLLVSTILGTMGCWQLKSKIIAATTVLVILAALSVGAGMGLFHGYYYLEQYKIIQAPLIGLVLQNSSYADLRRATSCIYGFSYILGWIGLAASIISFLLFLSVVIHVWRSTKVPETEMKLKSIAHQTIVDPIPVKQLHWPQTEQNRAYHFFDDVLHHPTVPTTYPIPFDSYDLHLPTGVSSNALQLPKHHYQPGKFDVPMLHATLPVNY